MNNRTLQQSALTLFLGLALAIGALARPAPAPQESHSMKQPVIYTYISLFGVPRVSWAQFETANKNARKLNEGLVAVLKIDVQGAITAMGLRPDAISIFLLPPDEEELLRRLRDRGTEEGAVLEKRIRNAQLEMGQADTYQYRVINDNIERAVDQLQEIVSG